MHSDEHQKILDSMTKKDKNNRTKCIEFQKRGMFVKGYEKRYLTKNEYPHTDRKEQLILWYRTLVAFPSVAGLIELGKIMKGYDNRYILRHPKSTRSVGRYHLHIFKM